MTTHKELCGLGDGSTTSSFTASAAHEIAHHFSVALSPRRRENENAIGREASAKLGTIL